MDGPMIGGVTGKVVCLMAERWIDKMVGSVTEQRSDEMVGLRAGLTAGWMAWKVAGLMDG